jgi:type VI secretion system Hcp family effector
MAQLLDVPNIAGESTHPTNPNWNKKIQIASFNYDVSQKASLQTGSGLVAGGASMSHITITKAMDISTPFWFYYLCLGQPITTVTFRLTRAGGVEGVYEYMTIVCNKVLVSSYFTSGTRGDGNMPMETISLSVGSVKESYDDRNEQGQKIQNVSHGFDFMQNTAL